MERYAFIHNPAARAGKSQSQLPVLKELIDQLPAAKLFHSEFKGDIGALVEETLSDFDIFVACGGDGTVQEIASKLIHTDKILGIIPMGTGNDLCKTLNIPSDIKQSFKVLLEGNLIKMDVGRYNNQIFLNSFGIGFDGLTNRYAYERNYLPPFLRYAVAALKATMNHKQFSVMTKQVNCQESKHEFIMVTFANGRVEGGAFWIAPDAELDDGKLNFIAISPIQKWLIPFLLPVFLLKKPNWIPHFSSRKIEKINLRLMNDAVIHADGEIVKLTEDNLSISLIPNKLKVISGP